MRRRIATTALLAAVVAIALSVPALVESHEERERNKVDRCADNGGRTLDANRSIRIYLARDHLDNQMLRGCWVRSGGVVPIHEAARRVTDLVPEYRIAERYIGYARINQHIRQPIPEFPVSYVIIVRNVKTKAFVATLAGRWPESRPAGYRTLDALTDLELSDEGAVAWIISRPPDAGGYFFVQKADAAGRTLLDEGSAIDPRSLAISGNRIYWVNGGQVRSALLEGTPPERCVGDPC